MKLKSVISALVYLLRTYSTARPRVIYRCTFSLFIDPYGTQTFVNQVLNVMDLEQDDPVLGSVDVKDLFNGGGATSGL